MSTLPEDCMDQTVHAINGRHVSAMLPIEFNEDETELRRLFVAKTTPPPSVIIEDEV